jgi:hypothetical protein
MRTAAGVPESGTPTLAHSCDCQIDLHLTGERPWRIGLLQVEIIVPGHSRKVFRGGR